MIDLAKGPLSGRRVLEVGDESGMYCGKLLADLGADVVRVERPGGDRARMLPPVRRGLSLPFVYLNTNKRFVEWDLEAPAGREAFIELAAGVDIILDAFAPGVLASQGLDYETLRSLIESRNPRFVMTSITGFGQSGPHRDYASSDLVVNAMGGAMYVTGDPEDPPVVLAGSQAHRMASTCAASASLIAMRHAERCGVGQHVDISSQEVLLAVSHITGIGKYLDDGIVPVRNGTSLFASVPSGAYPCKDGLVYLMVNRPLHWKALAEWIREETGNQEVGDPMFEGPSSVRIEYRELLDLFISDLTIKYTVQEIYHEGQRRHIAMTPVNRALDVLQDPHLKAQEFFVDVEAEGATGGLQKVPMPGPAYRLSVTPCRRPVRFPACVSEIAWSPRSMLRTTKEGSAKSSASEQPLAGIRVIEFTAGMAGPWIGRFMAYCGAEVIKVESQKFPSVVRLYIPPRQRDLGIQPALSPWFTDWDAGKQFVSLDLTNPEAVELAKGLVAGADVVIENNSTGVMEKLGLGYEVLAGLNEDLIHLSTTGFGDTGPCAKYVTWGSNIEAISGLSRLSGFPARECTTTQFAYPDAVGALHGLVVVMAALDHRDRRGEGQHISLSQLEATIAAIGSAMMGPLSGLDGPERMGNASRHMAPHGCYPCRGEDRWCAISIADESQWRAFCRAIGHAEWRDEPRYLDLERRLAHAEELDEDIAVWTREQDPYAVVETLQAVAVPAGVVQSVVDLLENDPHIAERKFFEEIPHLAKGTVRATGIPLGLTSPPGRTTRAGADYGEDNDTVLGEILGLDASEIARLRESGAIEVSGD